MNNELEDAHKALAETMTEVLKLRRENEELQYRLTTLRSSTAETTVSKTGDAHDTMEVADRRESRVHLPTPVRAER